MKSWCIAVGGRLREYNHAVVAGVINVTPDSFSDTDHCMTEDAVIRKTEKLLSDGADWLDIGGCSTRPDGVLADEETEWQRVKTALHAVKCHFPEAVVSVDTFRAEIARRAVLEGADIINDISGGQWDESMFATIAGLSVPYVLSFMPQPAERRTAAEDKPDIMARTVAFLQKQLTLLHREGVKDVIIDPGFGFAKSLNENYEVLSRFGELRCLGAPLMAGLSRKSMIYKTLNCAPAEADNGTTVLNTIALMNGADILRVHNVKAAAEAARLCEKTTEVFHNTHNRQ